MHAFASFQKHLRAIGRTLKRYSWRVPAPLRRVALATVLALGMSLHPGSYAQAIEDDQLPVGYVKPTLEPLVPTGGVPGVLAYDLIKLANDNDPETHADEAVYYLDKDWSRRPFPNQSIYKSWYPDFSGVKSLNAEQLASFKLGRNIKYRPGTRLIKIPSIPKVYAVEPNGRLRWIESEQVAINLFGADWNKRVDDVSETEFGDYSETVSLATPVWPTGTVLKRTEDGALFFVDAYGRRDLTPEALATMHLNVAYAVPVTEAQVSALPDLGAVPAESRRYSDTAQQDFVETLPPPQVQVIQASETFETGAPKQVLGRLHFTVGELISVKQLRVFVEGVIFGEHMHFANFQIVDAKGESIFGTLQATEEDLDNVTLTFSGVHIIAANSATDLFLIADTHPHLEAGDRYFVTFKQDGLVLDAADGTKITRYYQRPGGFEVINAVAK